MSLVLSYSYDFLVEYKFPHAHNVQISFNPRESKLAESPTHRWKGKYNVLLE